MRKSFLVLPVFLTFLLAGLCAATARAGVCPYEFRTPLPVMVSIPPQKYIVDRIGGNAVDVSVMVKPGSDPHSFEPSPAQMRECSKSALYFSIGVPFEDIWLPRISHAETSGKNDWVVSMIRDVSRLPLGDERLSTALSPELLGLAGEERNNGQGQEHDDSDDGHGHQEHSHAGDDHSHEHEHGSEDPHVWLSPRRVQQMLPVVVERLSAEMPEYADIFSANAARLGLELEVLHRKIQDIFLSVPQDKRVFLTFHPSWGYFSLDYGLTELSIEVDGKEPGPRTMRAIIDLARANGLRAVFIEPQFPEASARAVAENIGAQVRTIDPLAENILENLEKAARTIAASMDEIKTD